MTRFICVSSGKGGVGKTTAAVNIASEFAKKGVDTVLVDGNISTPHVHLHLGGDGFDRGIHDAIQDKVHITQLVYRHVTGIRVVPSLTSMNHLKYPDHEGFKHALTDLKGFADVVIIDSAPGFGREALVPMEISDEILLVTTPDHAALEDARRTIDVSREIRKHLLGVVLNMVRGDKHEHSVDEVEKYLGLPVIASVPHDDRVKVSLREKTPVTHKHRAGGASSMFIELAEHLIGPRYAEMLEEENDRGLTGYVRKNLGIK